MAIYETSLKTREALIKAAGELAAELGFPSVSTRAIAEKANENIGSIHYHFGGKEQLFEEVIKTVIKVWRDNPVSELLQSYDLNQPYEQARAIRALVHHNIVLLFGRELPNWHCRVIFQVMHHKSPLQDIFREELIKPFHNSVNRLLKHINPEMDKKDMYLRILIMNAPIFFHADRMDFILANQGARFYSQEYLRKMEDLIVKQTQFSLGLPLC